MTRMSQGELVNYDNTLLGGLGSTTFFYQFFRFSFCNDNVHFDNKYIEVFKIYFHSISSGLSSPNRFPSLHTELALSLIHI